MIEQTSLPQITHSDLPSAEERFEMTFNQAAVGMSHVGLDGSWLLVNKKFCDILGFSKEELLTMKFQDLTLPEDLADHLNIAKKVFSGRMQNFSVEKRYRRKDGSITWVQVTTSVVSNSEGHPLYLITVTEDINQRKNYELELERIKIELQKNINEKTLDLKSANRSLVHFIEQNEKTKNQLDQFFQLSSDILLTCAPDKTVLEVNPAFERILGYTPAEIIGHKISTLIYEEDLVRSAMQGSGIEYNKVFSNFENRLIAKNGSLIWFSWSYLRLKDENSFFCIARDITAAKNQEKLIADQKLKMANVSKMNSLNRMAAGIAHEINNPMMVIYGQVYLIKKYILKMSPMPTYLLESLEKIDVVAQRVKKIVNGLRSFSKDGSKDPFEAISLGSLITETLPYCRGNLKQENIDLRIQPGLETVKVYGQAVQISQVLLNLIENSLDAIVVDESSERWIELSFHHDVEKKFVFLSVTDGGHGLDPSTLENLFQPFFTTKPVGKGTGLGLSISKSIMLSNNGDLFVDTSKSNTTFVMKIPTE